MYRSEILGEDQRQLASNLKGVELRVGKNRPITFHFENKHTSNSIRLSYIHCTSVTGSG